MPIVIDQNSRSSNGIAARRSGFAIGSRTIAAPSSQVTVASESSAFMVWPRSSLQPPPQQFDRHDESRDVESVEAVRIRRHRAQAVHERLILHEQQSIQGDERDREAREQTGTILPALEDDGGAEHEH